MEATTSLEQPITYCLYARKSSESDERQAMSIDSQVKEMTDLAIKEKLTIKEVRQESHSAKESGQRPVFVQLLSDIRNGMFNGLLTWAPDRLSRNAGDLGMLVDLMDQEKLMQIRTFSQIFSNNPNEKFLLMILCSQAKLENDQKGINVKRGIRAKCEMGWRPGPPPIGYFNRSFAGVKDIIVDPERGPVIKEMFKKVSEHGDSGRTIKRWLDGIKFTTRAGKRVTLSIIYQMLKNPFYYGEFKYPIKDGIWYLGKHEPLINKAVFNKVQEQLKTSQKSPWGEKVIIFKGLFRCGTCKENMIGEDRLRKRKNGLPPRQHIYYHCARQMGPCPEPYISEEKLVRQILRYINFMNIAHPDFLRLTEKLKNSTSVYKSVREEILCEQNINPNGVINPVNFARYVLSSGSIQEKRDLVLALGKQMYVKNGFLGTSIEETVENSENNI